MKRPLTIIVALMFVLALLLSMMTYPLRFTEAAVLTTFGKAGDGAVQLEPGLKFKWPYPVQSVTKYDTRLRYVAASKQQQQTADNRQVVVEAYAMWRVSDPLKFFQSFSNAGARSIDHYTAAEQIIRSSLSGALSEVSRYRMDEFFSAVSASKIPDLEKAVLTQVSGGQAGTLAARGIEVIDVGLSQVRLPESTSQSVFERMGADRDRLANELEGQGNAQASAIRSQAQSDAEKILAFARARAEQVRVLGDQEAAPWLQQLNKEPRLAIFLNETDFMKNIEASSMTLVMPSTMTGLGLFAPTALQGLRPGQVPGIASEPSVVGAVERAVQQRPAGAAESKPDTKNDAKGDRQ